MNLACVLNIEENFLDDKSAGFQLESSQIRDAEASLAFVLSWLSLPSISSPTVFKSKQTTCAAKLMLIGSVG